MALSHLVFLLAARLNTSFLGVINSDTALQYKLTVSAKGVPLCKIEKQVQVRVRAAPTGQIDTVGNANTLVATYVRGDLDSWSVFGGFLGGNLRSDTVQVSWQQPWANSHKVLSFLVNQYDCKATLVYPRPEVILPPALPNETANNIATRNEDQANEYLTIDNQRSNLAYTMQVSNRWGKVVHSGTYTPTAWPKADTPIGTYFFTITAPGRPMLKGWFEVVR